VCVELHLNMGFQISYVKYHPLLVPFCGPSDYGYRNSQRIIGLCEVVDICGMSGFGEIYASSYFPPEIMRSLLNHISGSLLNKQLERPEDFYENFTIPFISNSGLIETLVGGIDIAIWDLFLKSNELTLGEYLLIKDNNVPKLYLSSGSNFMNSVEIADECASLDERFSGYKLRVSFNDRDVDFRRVEAAACGLKNGQKLMIDSIMSTNPKPWNLPTAIDMVLKFLEFNPTWIEEPLHPNNFLGYQELCRLFPNLIALGEALVGELEFRAVETIPDLGFIQLDPTQNGGLTKTLMLLSRFSESNLAISMHVWGSKLSFNLNYQIASLFPIITWVEYPGYTLEIDQLIGDASLTNSMIGFSDLKTLDSSSFIHSWSSDDGIYRVR
jgi:L-alanine-DL-glutamate epimerase-like enolase superfamily enzyme